MNTEQKIQNELFKLHDEPYKIFSAKLIPNIPDECIIGIPTPKLRKFAKDIHKTSDADNFIKILPHKYHEENCLHGFIIESINDYDRIIKELDIFLPYVNNWATCDSICPKIFKKQTAKLYEQIKIWINSNDTYTVRFALKMLMTHFLDEHFTKEVLDICACVQSDEYYIRMMIAWFFATALAKQYDNAVTYIENKTLDGFTHNKAIQKACESFRISDERKAYLKKLKTNNE